jgi:hypothetical protein
MVGDVGHPRQLHRDADAGASSIIVADAELTS